MAFEINRNIHKRDAAGQAPGRLASEIAPILMGKHKVDYQPNVDNGDFVEVDHCADMKITGKKLEQKLYRRHSMYLGGLKEKQMKKVFEEDPGQVLKEAVSRMLPKNKFRTARLKRLVIK